MAGPGGGPPRRSHTKSRKGCETCKRRHIRCDENFPQCRNCTKHNCRCPYMDMPVQEERAVTPEKADLLWTPEIEAEIERWQRTGAFPFPDLYIFPAPSPQFYSVEDLRLIHHVASVSSELNFHDAGDFAIWTRQVPLFLKLGTSYVFVMHALLALSATHLAWLTDCPLTANMAYEHRGVALKGLHEAIGAFSRDNSDAILAASLLLSWQATEWRGWTQLMHGTSSVIDAMQPWAHESQFVDFIAEQSTFPTAPPSPAPNSKILSQPRKADLDALQGAYAQLQKVEAHLKSQGGDVQAIQQLLSFVRSVRKVSPSHTAAQRFEMLNPLRAWLFWLPVMFLQKTPGSPLALIILAHYYTVALVVEPLFPEVGAAYFGSLSVNPIEEIARRLFSISVSQTSDDLESPLSLMEYPIDMVANFRGRMGWVQPERTASFPTFREHSFDLESMDGSFSEPTFPWANPAFTYSQEEFITMPPGTPSTSAITPLTLDPYANQYLGIPSPSGFGGYHSPASSAFGGDRNSISSIGSAYGGDRNSIIWSDHGYSDVGEDFALYDTQGQGSNFGGINPSFTFGPTLHDQQQQPRQLQEPLPQQLGYSPGPSVSSAPPGDIKGKGREV